MRGFGVQEFANETGLQRFVEDRVAPVCGLRVVASSLRGRGRLGFIDTIAIDAGARPVLIEYKLDTVGAAVVEQLQRYKAWLAKHPEVLRAAVVRRYRCEPTGIDRPTLVAVGYRFRCAEVAKTRSVTFIRYGYAADQTAWLRVLDPVTKSDWIAAPPRFSKEGYLPKHFATTTPAAGEAFDWLRRRLCGAGFAETIHGKNRVIYANGRKTIKVVFTSVAVQVFFNGAIDTDSRPRLRRPDKGNYDWTCGVVTTADVEPVAQILGI